MQNTLIHAVEIEQGTEEFVLAGNKTGKVYSIYDKAVNLLIDNRLIVIMGTDSEQAPDALITDYLRSFLNLMIKKDDYVLIFDDHIQIGKHTVIDISYYKRYCINAGKFENRSDMEELTNNLERIRSLVRCYGKASPLYEAYYQTGKTGIMKEMFADILQEMRKAGFEGSCEYMIKNAFQMQGLGIGLTPSGDDFLNGLIITLICWKPDLQPVFEKYFSINMGRTNLISTQMIDNAIRKRARKSELDFIDAFFAGNWMKIKQSLFKVVQFGSTSGTDTMLGILFGIEYIVKMKRKGCK